MGFSHSYASDTTSAHVWSTADAGISWTSFTPDGLQFDILDFNFGAGLYMSDPLNGILYSPVKPSAYTTQDGGYHWTAVTPSASLLLAPGSSTVSGMVGNGVFWQSSGSRLSLSADRGQTWHDAAVQDEAAASADGRAWATVIQYIDANEFVVEFSHRYYLTRDGGQTFRHLFGPDSRDAHASFATGEFLDRHNGRFLTANGALLSTTDGGRTWSRRDAPTASRMPVALHFTSATQGWRVLDGQLAQTTDGGATWSVPASAAALRGLRGMSWGDATHGWAWNATVLFVTADAGATWSASSVVLYDGIASATMTGPLAGVVVSIFDQTVLTQDGGTTWQSCHAPNLIGSTHTLVRAGGQTVWTFGVKTLRSTDGGCNWEGVGLDLGGALAIGMAFGDARHGWLITRTGRVLSTVDGGDTWSAQPVGDDLVLEAVVAVDAMTAWIITQDGQILATANGGN